MAVSAQTTAVATLSEDSIHKDPGISPYIFGHVQYGQFSERISFFGGGGLGILVSERWQLEAEFNTIINQYIKKVVFPESYRLKYWHVGVSFRYHVFHRKKLWAYLGGRGAAGQLRWVPVENSGSTYTDNLYLVTPETGVGFKPFPFLAAELGLGYNQAFDLEIIGLEDNALNGFVLTMRLKLIKNNGGK